MRIVIPGNPIVKARPKFCIRGKHALAYDSQNQDKIFAKSDLKLRVEEYFTLNRHQISSFKASFSHQKMVSLWFYIPIPISDSCAERTKKLWLPEFGDWRSKKDLDNFIKWTLDIGNEILWHDDSQITELHAYQQYSEKTCTIIEVEDIKMIVNEDTEKMMRIFSPAALTKLEDDLRALINALESVRFCEKEGRKEYLEFAADELKKVATIYGLAFKKMTSNDNKK